MRRTLVGGRSLFADGGGLGHLGFGAGQPIGQLRDLPGEFHDHAVLLLHVALEEGQTFFEVAEAVIHGGKMTGEAAGATSVTYVSMVGAGGVGWELTWRLK